MARYIITRLKNGVIDYTDQLTNETREKVKESVKNVVMEGLKNKIGGGFLLVMDIVDHLYSIASLYGKATRTFEGVKFVLTCEKEPNEVVNFYAKEHTPSYIPQTKEEIMDEHWARKANGMFRGQNP